MSSLVPEVVRMVHRGLPSARDTTGIGLCGPGARHGRVVLLRVPVAREGVSDRVGQVLLVALLRHQVGVFAVRRRGFARLAGSASWVARLVLLVLGLGLVPLNLSLVGRELQQALVRRLISRQE